MSGVVNERVEHGSTPAAAVSEPRKSQVDARGAPRGWLRSLHGAIGNRATSQLLASAGERVRVSDPSEPREQQAERLASAALRGEVSERPGEVANPSPSRAPLPGLVPGGGAPLPADQRAPFEAGLGHRLDKVRVHRGKQAEELAAGLNARAYSVGDDVVLGEQHGDPQTPAGREVLMHEFAHHALGHGQDGAVMRRAARANPLADPTKDNRQASVRSMIADAKLEASEAQDVVNLAKDDAKLRQGEKDPTRLEPAIINLYVRAGVPMKEARRLAGRTLELARVGAGEEAVSREDAKEPTNEEKGKIRTAAEEDARNNVAANQLWRMDQTVENRADFLRNVVQIDGDTGTTSDFKACAPTSLLAGIILSRPQSIQELGKQLQGDAGKQEFPGMQKEPVQSAVARLATGKFSPKDVSVVANGLYASVRYTLADGTLSEGVSMANQMALIGRLQKIGFITPAMRQDTYGTLNRMGTHATAFANNTGYDSWPYPGSRGQAMLTDGDTAARNQALAVGPRLGLPTQKRVLLERLQQDGKGGITLERHTVDGVGRTTPLKAHYTLNTTENRWERDPKVVVPADQEENLPRYIPLDVAKRRDMKIEKI